MEIKSDDIVIVYRHCIIWRHRTKDTTRHFFHCGPSSVSLRAESKHLNYGESEEHENRQLPRRTTCKTPFIYFFFEVGIIHT